MRTIIDYNPEEHRIVGADRIRYFGGEYLLLLQSPYAGEFIALKWLPKMPRSVSRVQAVLRVTPSQIATLIKRRDSVGTLPNPWSLTPVSH